MAVSVKPLDPPSGSEINFGAVVDNVDLDNLDSMLGEFTARRRV